MTVDSKGFEVVKIHESQEKECLKKEKQAIQSVQLRELGELYINL